MPSFEYDLVFDFFTSLYEKMYFSSGSVTCSSISSAVAPG